MVLRRFPDVQKVIADSLVAAGLVAAGHAGAQTPTDLQEQLPFIRVIRLGGGSDRLSDVPSVDVDVFAGLYTTAELLAEQVREFLVGPPPPTHRLDRVECLSGPRELPWDDDGVVRRFGATYQLSARRTVVVA
jgi:hypothetical protein